MAISDIHDPTGKLFWGNVLLIFCCVFYLAWWAVAFKPNSSAGMVKMITLFVLAAGTGIAGVYFSVKGIGLAECERQLMSGRALLIVGIIAYIVLLLITTLVFKRQVTTELLLIIGWAILALAVVNVLYGTESFSFCAAVIFCVIIGITVIVSLACYILYYNLDKQVGYIVGMVPLALAALVMAGITVKSLTF